MSVIAVACSGQVQPVTPTELACYTRADADAQEMVDLLCPDVAFAQCPEHDAIMERLKRSQEECRD